MGITDVTIEPANNREEYIVTVAGYTDDGDVFSEVNVATPEELIKFISERMPYLPKPKQQQKDNSDNVRPFPSS